MYLYSMLYYIGRLRRALVVIHGCRFFDLGLVASKVPACSTFVNPSKNSTFAVTPFVLTPWVHNQGPAAFDAQSLATVAYAAGTQIIIYIGWFIAYIKRLINLKYVVCHNYVTAVVFETTVIVIHAGINDFRHGTPPKAPWPCPARARSGRRSRANNNTTTTNNNRTATTTTNKHNDNDNSNDNEVARGSESRLGEFSDRQVANPTYWITTVIMIRTIPFLVVIITNS